MPVAASTSGTCRFPMDWNSPSSRPNKTAITAARQHASTRAATAPAQILAGVDHAPSAAPATPADASFIDSASTRNEPSHRDLTGAGAAGAPR